MDISNIDFTPLYLSGKLAFVSTFFLIILAAPIAYTFAYRRFAGKAFLEALINLPLALPPTVLGFYLLVVMGPNGWMGRSWEAVTGSSLVFTFAGIVIASIVSSFPFAIQPMKAAFEKIDRSMLESAYVLGLSPLSTFLRVIIPNSVSGVAAAAILVFIHSIGAFGVLLMVGGSIPGETKVISIAIYEAVESLAYREAGLMCLVLIPIGYSFLLLLNLITRRSRVWN
ncbi:MAG: molybdate ABC transporter permease subunit [Deltaproteobacteria bacterium]|nr:molybdate ABC transporter permease subunit [Deltaproteobacteria bacterium]